MPKMTSKAQATKTAPSRLASAPKKSQDRSGSPLTASELRQVEELAYSLYEQRGFLHGNDREDWLKAEAIVRSRRS